MNFTILVWLYCLRILASCKNFNFSSWERSSSHVLTVIPILCFNVPLNVSSKFPLPGNYDSFMIEMEKAVATHSSTLVWKIPWMEEPGGLQSMGSPRVGHDWATSLSLFTFLHWRRKWQPTPVFLPGESQGWGAWWAAVYGVAQSRTRLKRLSSSSSSLGTATAVVWQAYS